MCEKNIWNYLFRELHSRHPWERKTKKISFIVSAEKWKTENFLHASVKVIKIFGLQLRLIVHTFNKSENSENFTPKRLNFKSVKHLTKTFSIILFCRGQNKIVAFSGSSFGQFIRIVWIFSFHYHGNKKFVLLKLSAVILWKFGAFSCEFLW